MDRIAAQLKQDEHCTVEALAQAHGVSTRTIARDLEVMREQGMQIDADRGRGGGIRLDRSWGVGRLNLSYSEAVDLLISIAVAEQMNSPMFLANLSSVKRQLVASFSTRQRDRVARMKSRILIGVTASTFVQAGSTSPPRRVVQTLHQAFIDTEAMEIDYRREDGLSSKRVVEPHYLLLKYPVWYVLAFDHLHQTPRTFRCDRISRAMRTGDQFALLPKAAFHTALERDQNLR